MHFGKNTFKMQFTMPFPFHYRIKTAHIVSHNNREYYFVKRATRGSLI